jgi:hypothetical protein
MVRRISRFFCLVFLALSAAIGCQPTSEQAAAPQPAAAPVKREPVRLLIIDDAGLATVIPRQWESRADRELVVRQMTSQELMGLRTKRLAADAIVYPSGLLGELSSRQWIEPLHTETLRNELFARRDLFEMQRLREVSWGREVAAVSFGSPQFTLMYRRDMFEKSGLAPPQTWGEYQRCVERLADRQKLGDLAPPQDKPWSAVIEPLGDGWAGQLLLARAAAYAQHRSQFSTLFDYRDMKPLVAGPPFVRALKELVAASKQFPATAAQMGPNEARREFFSGRCAMTLTWPSRADDQSVEGSAVPAAFAELPGSVDAYNFRTESWEPRGEAADQRVTLAAVAGRLGSVTRECREPLVAANLLLWVTGKLSTDICPESKAGTLFRESHLPQASRWLDRQLDEFAAKGYAEAVRDAQNRTAWVASVRIPGRMQYLAALDQAVRDAMSGTDSAEALKKAGAAWDKITETAGRAAQREAYMRSIGLEP